MVQEHPQHAKGVVGFRSENPEVNSVSATPAGDDSALSQLNVSEAFRQVRDQKVDMTHEASDKLILFRINRWRPTERSREAGKLI